jgi:hypothetical protein
VPVFVSLLIASLLNAKPDEKAVAPRPRFELASPLPGVPGVMMDSHLNGVGLAQQTARAQGLQARILWVDATANIDRYNTPEKIQTLMARVQKAGFNTVVLDVKPISGQVIYPSALAPKLTEWRGKTLPADFDPVPHFITNAKQHGLGIYASLNAFSEGHRMFLVGPGYAKTDQQTILYETQNVVKSTDGRTFPLATKLDTLQPGTVGVFTNLSKLPADFTEGFILTLRPNGRVADGYQYVKGGPMPTMPRGGSLVVGAGDAGEFLADSAEPGRLVQFDTKPLYVPISERPEQQYPLMMNINHPQVQQYAFDIASEVVRNYAFDGIIYDDRLRYAGINADFSELTKKLFEEQIGKPINWPDDVFKFTVNPNLTRGQKPGPYYDEWMAFRADRIRQFVAGIRTQIANVRPGTQLGIYAGSWYGEYPNIGSNWASDSVASGFWFSTPAYQKSGFASEIDFFISGCYYPIPTIHEAMSRGANPGLTVEAAGALTNRMVGDQTWSYAGIALSTLNNDPEVLGDVLQAACASTQGVMVFDLSHDIDQYWDTFERAFALPRPSPHSVRGLISDVRRKRAAYRAAGKADPPVIIIAGGAGTGQ